jgi:hypothetical protein
VGLANSQIIRYDSSMLTQKQLKKRLLYNPRTGAFTWLTGSRGRRDIGKQAGGLDPSNGHIRIYIGGKRQYASRLAYLYMTGKWPPTALMDHRDHNPANNKWTNIRPATPSQNMCNRRVIRAGLKGVTPINSRFKARISINGKKLHLGYFATEAAAHRAYRIAAVKYFGEFANFG